MILALAGGVGGGKLAHGLAMRLNPGRLSIVVNTGDDFRHLGFHVSPDLDTVMYWLAGCNDAERGWGLASETWNFMSALEKLGGPIWFSLGDRDLATHAERTRRLADGESLSAVTRHLCRQFAIAHDIAPMTDDAVRTIVHCDEGALEFQHYFVRRRCEPRIQRIEYGGAPAAAPSTALDAALADPRLEAIVLCPSNPWLSIEPILQVGAVRARIAVSPASVIAVSPIVGGRALKGPAGKIMQEMGREPSALEIARHYRGLTDGIVIDQVDAGLRGAIEALGLAVVDTNTVMTCAAECSDLARVVLEFAASLAEDGRAARLARISR